jgi:predicted CoA-binding protein
VSRNVDQRIEAFLAGSAFAVAGASRFRHKYGNMVLRCYWQHGRVAFAVNPTTSEIEGAACYPSLSHLPQRVHGVSLITRPEVSATVVDQALELGIRHFWFQPGAESELAIARAEKAGSVVIAGGPCLLVVLGFNSRA